MKEGKEKKQNYKRLRRVSGVRPPDAPPPGDPNDVAPYGKFTIIPGGGGCCGEYMFPVTLAELENCPAADDAAGDA